MLNVVRVAALAALLVLPCAVCAEQAAPAKQKAAQP